MKKEESIIKKYMSGLGKKSWESRKKTQDSDYMSKIAKNGLKKRWGNRKKKAS